MTGIRNTSIIFVLILLQACASQGPQYRNDNSTENEDFSPDEDIIRSFVLIGDAGEEKLTTEGSGLEAMAAYLDSVQDRESFILFLGDNTDASALVSGSSRQEAEAEDRLDRQAEAVEDHPGKPIFIPGELEWDEEGMDGLEAEEEYLQEILENEDVFMPRTGCPLQFVDISDDVHLIILDSQWYLADWDEHPTVNDDCPEIKTREAMLLEVETELKKNQNKTTVFALHHPLRSNGVHGGKFNLSQYLAPSQKKFPVPVVGSLAMMLRTTGGISIQDLQNERYKTLIQRLETIADKWGNVVFASGHEHSLQYIEDGHIKQIVSGAGSIGTYAGLGKNGLFSYEKEGFAVFDVFEDGSSRISFFGNAAGKPKLLYRKEVFEGAEPYPVDTLESSFPEVVEASVYEAEEENEGELYETIWGEGYRDLYYRDIKVAVADLDTLYGGLEPMRMGGGHQTNSLRVRDSLDREYNFRKIRKDAVQFLQAVAYKDRPVSEQFENTLPQRVIEDFYTASHPYAFLAIPTLASAVDVLHTNPELYYLPKQPELGKYNFEHGNDLYMIEERPEEHWLGYESFGSPNHDIQSTEGMFDRLRRDEQYSVDEEAYIRARIFDMLIGDWDRHNDQWRWAEIEDENGDRTFVPIPRDRDQVFSNFDGALFSTLRGVLGFANQFGVYGEDINDIEWFNTSATSLDRFVIQSSGKEVWQEQAEFIQENISDEIIAEAFSNLPEEAQGETTEDLKEKLKGRRGNIVDITRRYYDHLADLAIVRGTDKDDYVDITRMADGKTRVRISRNKDGERDEVVSDRIYSAEETEEVWVYGLDDDDQFYVEGRGDDPVMIRIIGGQNNDIYHIENGEAIKIYDHKSKPNTIEENQGAAINFTDDYEVNLYDMNRKITRTNAILPSVGYNPDDGVILGVRTTYTISKFIRNPFTSRHQFGAGYFSATQGFEADYEGQFAKVLGNYNLGIGAFYSSPKNTRNFFGLGNETRNPEDDAGMDYNRIRISRFGGEAGFVRESPYGSYFSYMASFEGVEVEDTAERFLLEEFTQKDEFYERKYFAGLEGTYRYESYDDRLNPSRGMLFELVGGAKMNVQESENSFAYVNPHLELYNAISANRKWVLKTMAQAEINFSENYEFYQSAKIGGNSGLRGYRHERFAGQQAFAAGADLRYSLERFKTTFLPFQVGFFAGYDLGRVWMTNQESNVWHQSYGGGFWINSAEAVSGTFNFFSGSEGWRFSFGFGVRF